ncbi:MAG: MFS transporter [Hamadaea sp.]|uniref:MFS transporter n=1 Tax=Hamadaea sp. TaxID=2024425 RepID=UPI0017CDC07F|nr:MFS transporter [Hamadaea sp.]NUR72644.1 MFS transporter [Hamadaea sp.]NUT19739.1 MFS transporter [Hamadaea sp.]
MSSVDVVRIQRRTVRVLVANEIVSGLGVAIGISVGALLTKEMVGTALSGVAQSVAVVGAALSALPASRIMNRYGRRPGLALSYLVGAAGAITVVAAAAGRHIALLIVGMFLFGAGNTGKYQSRYAAADLARPEKRGRQLSWVIWASTIGAVAGPNLAAPVGRLVAGTGIPTLAAPYLASAATFLACAVWILAVLRPDPLKLAKQLAPTPLPVIEPVGSGAVATVAPPVTTATRVTFREAAAVVWSVTGARLGLVATALGHLVMVGVMSMTPIHIGQTHHGTASLTIVGFVIGLHIAGMYGLSPLVGWATDRLGPRRVILAGVVLLVAACAVAGASGDDVVRLTLGLILLGQGWSCTMVAGSTLFAASVPLPVKAAAQGLSDLTTGVAGASAGLLSGVIVQYASYGVLTLLAAFAVVPLLALVLRTGQAGSTDVTMSGR